MNDRTKTITLILQALALVSDCIINVYCSGVNPSLTKEGNIQG